MWGIDVSLKDVLFKATYMTRLLSFAMNIYQMPKL